MRASVHLCLLTCPLHVCAVLLPGWYARSMSGSIITATGPCPQGYYCECLQALIALPLSVSLFDSTGVGSDCHYYRAFSDGQQTDLTWLLQAQEGSPPGRLTQPVPSPTPPRLPQGAGWRRMRQQAPYSPARTACGPLSWQQLL